MSLSRVAVKSQIGTWTVEGDDEGLTKIYLPHERIRSTSQSTRLVSAAARQLDEYFAGKRRNFDIDLHIEGTDFQTRVWTALANIPYGTVQTYAEVATSVGHPRAFRAVGSANSRNPFPVVVACHRVVASTGLGGYAGGLDVKRFLLELEGAL
jgi:methylated-DNA-[protein]-cysteine S-methyltransferase